MKTLLILRHSKSSWDDPGLADIDRPLNKRGKRDAPRMGKLLREVDLVPDLILTSPARRALNTAQAVAEESGYGGDIEINTDFYPGDPIDYIEALGKVPDEHQIVMVVGHNPGLEELLVDLTSEAISLPTAALAQVILPIDMWAEMDDQIVGKLVNLWQVKGLN